MFGVISLTSFRLGWLSKTTKIIIYNGIAKSATVLSAVLPVPRIPRKTQDVAGYWQQIRRKQP